MNFQNLFSTLHIGSIKRDSSVKPTGSQYSWIKNIRTVGCGNYDDIGVSRERWQGLGDAYRVEASFIIWEGKDVLQVPASALFRKGDEWAVFVIEGNRARERVVSIGHRNGLAAEVLSGLTERERVIAYPDRAVADGVRVRVRQGS